MSDEEITDAEVLTEDSTEESDVEFVEKEYEFRALAKQDLNNIVVARIRELESEIALKKIYSVEARLAGNYTAVGDYQNAINLLEVQVVEVLAVFNNWLV